MQGVIGTKMLKVTSRSTSGDTGADDAPDHSIPGPHQHLQHDPNQLPEGNIEATCLVACIVTCVDNKLFVKSKAKLRYFTIRRGRLINDTDCHKIQQSRESSQV